MLLLFVSLVLAVLLAALSQTVLSAAMPTMVGELGGVDQMLWVMTAFILASTVAMPIYGKVSDLIGRKAPLIVAISVFIAGSVLGGLAPDMGVLIAARAVQGLGGGGLMILAQAIIADVVPSRERGKYIGVIGAVLAVSSVAGPLIGGWLTEHLDWRWTFWMNVPLGLLALVAATTLLHLPRERASAKPAIDLFGMVTLAGATTSLILVASWGGNDFAWTSPVVLGLIASTIVFAGLFVLAESRAAEPIIPATLFRDRNFILATLAGLLIGVTMFGVVGYVPTQLQMTFGADPTVAGLLMVPLMGSMLITSVVTGWMISRYGRYKWIPLTGAGLSAGALVLLGTVTPETTLWLVCGYFGVLGLGFGATVQNLVLIVQNSFSNRIVGTATAAYNYFRQVGASLGSALVGSLFTVRLIDLVDERVSREAAARLGDVSSLTPDFVAGLPPSLRSVVVHSYNDALAPLFLWMAPLALVAVVLLCFLRETPLQLTNDHEIAAEALGEGQLLIDPEVVERPSVDPRK